MTSDLNPGVAEDGQPTLEFGGFPVGADPNSGGEGAESGVGLPAQSDGVPGTPGQPASPKDDPSRFEHWQSVADQYKNQLNELAPYVPLIQYINSNPQVMQTIEQQMMGGNPQRDAAPATPPPAPAPGLKIPEKPERPANYDPVAAYQDPTSDSWKFRDSMERYRDELQEYQVRKIEQAEKQEAERQQRAKVEQMRKMQMAQVQATVQTRYGLSQAEAIDFVQWMSNDDNVTPDALVHLYKIVRGKQSATPQRSQGGVPMGPVSPGVGGGHTEMPLNEEDEFSKDAIARWKGRGT